MAYPLVANYIRNTWSKYGLVKSMLNSSNGLFFFKFSSKDGLDAMLKNGPWFICNNPLILKKLNPEVNLLKEDVGNVPGRSSYARAMIKLRADVECSSCKLFGHVLDDCPKNIVSDVKKNLKNPKQAVRGVQVSRKVNFKPLKQVYRSVSNRNNDSFSGKKKQAAVVSKECGTSTTPVVERIDKIERKIIDEKISLVDDEGKPLPKVISTENVDSDSEVKDVVDDPAVFMASTGLKRGNDSGY
ncbi:zinc finger, CCHC-type containing protein, partial [Tanacetum coccineum]